jgi:hypothetical protein
MPKPTHVAVFDFISEGTQDEIRDHIAFGMFMKSEKSWVSSKESEPSEADYRRYHEFFTAYERERLRGDANIALKRYTDRAISEARDDLVKHHRKFRWFGVLEAAFGAAAWTGLLIVATIAAHRGGIDILDAYRRAYGGESAASVPLACSRLIQPPQ